MCTCVWGVGGGCGGGEGGLITFLPLLKEMPLLCPTGRWGGVVDRGSRPATSISASQHFSFLCVFHSLLFSYLLFYTQLLFIPPLFRTLLRTSKEADGDGGLGSVCEADYGLSSGFKKLALERVCRNGFTSEIS